ncbi:flavin monoamine oxidase family protein [Actinomadura chibensis]|nr:NAD(P)/FAD-dependent oxidoreductase [Actinomadura chibensis]
MTHDHDVIVIGAGFAGATAARECASRGLRTLLLEARDRVGGRTWTSRLSDGEVVEIGGTYVHWTQPHVWSEITRYGLEESVVPAAVAPEWALLPTASGLEWCDIEQAEAREKAVLDLFLEPSRTAFPCAHSPLAGGDAVTELDKLTLRDRLDQLNLSPDDRAHLSALVSIESAGSMDEGAFLSLLRWRALSGHSHEAMQEAVFGFKLADGTVSLLNRILADGGSELLLGEPVVSVAADGRAVRVTTANGRVRSAFAVVVATPSGGWAHIDFSPGLSPERLGAARNGLQSPGVSKIVAVVRGERRRVLVLPQAGHPIGLMWTSHQRSADEQVLEIFGTSALKDAGDPREVEAALRDLLPRIELVDMAAGSYLEDDEFAKGGWGFYKRGHLSGLAPHETFARPEGRLVFATSDIAAGWYSFIDGAIESGLRAGRQVREILRDGTA